MNHECNGCGVSGMLAWCGSDASPTWLGYACGCLDAFREAMTAGWTWRGAAKWAETRRKGTT